MKLAARAVLVSAGLLAGTAVAADDGGDPGEAWAHRAEAGVAAAQSGDLAAAERAFREARALAERLPPDDPRRATTANNLGFALHARGQLEEALACYREALALREAVFGRSHPITAQSLANLGEALRAAGQHAAAEDSHRRAVEIRRTRLPAGHPELADSLSAYGVLLTDRGRFDAAEALFREALAIRVQVLGERQLPVAEARSHLGALAFARGRLAEAERWYRQASEAEEAVFGPNDPALVAGLANLAVTVRLQGRPAEAAAIFDRTLNLRLAATDGAETAETARLRAALGAALAEAGAPDRARDELRRSVQAGERHLGGNDPALAEPLVALAALDRRARPEAALDLLRRAAALRAPGRPPGASGAATAVALHDLAVLRAERGELEEADRLFAQAAGIEGQAASELARTLASHAELLTALGRAETAASLRGRARALERAAAAGTPPAASP